MMHIFIQASEIHEKKDTTVNILSNLLSNKNVTNNSNIDTYNPTLPKHLGFGVWTGSDCLVNIWLTIKHVLSEKVIFPPLWFLLFLAQLKAANHQTHFIL